MNNGGNIKKPSLMVSIIPFIFLICFMLLGVIVFDSAPQIPLIICCGITAIIGKFLGHNWNDMEEAMIQTNSMAMQANFIIMIVGCLVGTWIAGGVVPGMIFYGLKLFTPAMFLFLLPIICAIVSVSTGSAWTTAGTMGTAAMGIGAGLGIPSAIIAGAVVTGASFGDKLSPLSDSTNLAAGVVGVNVFDHIRHMLYTTLPSFILSVIIFALIGMGYKGQAVDTTQINAILDTIQSSFNISPLIFIAPLSVILMIVFKVPAIPGMIGGTIIGVIFSFAQGSNVSEVLHALFYGFEISSGNAMVDTLLNRGGLLSMMETISLVMCALAFGGLVKQIGCLDTIINAILKHCHSRGSIILSNILSCIAMNFAAADQYISIVIPGQMYKNVYEKLNLHPKNLSRVLEDAGTLTSGLVPWSTCGAVYFSTLGVSAFAYAPFHFLGLINPIVSAIYGFTGFSLKPLDESKPIVKELKSEDLVENKPLQGIL
ncbi:MAG: Na+/H+ antiporter NhaC [Clostridium argentinense]|uniref:Na+/H+ antiporter NhaC n=1 Tax=Clostridium faecium TaxID=2762223 RepID=A0ABR8YSL0_9CLOT|nr:MULTISPECIES: Na+/H+ antiporter NhaC [Clostridium]MBD8047209.1 Na+/H+ antiporter NhaC [Clostridium faecium]MBS5822671.1 Na+/H+ antiporter NhaC [Clostridium argentinense]MDU1348409.1 Na+/H+ antiporter NhaC [Clostridium argentinense]